MTFLGDHNLAGLVERSFQARGDYPSLWFEGRWHRSGELLDRSHRLAAGLAELGVSPGDRVVVSMANCPEVGIAYQALWHAGAVITPATFLLPPQDLRHVIADSEACAVITTPELVPKVTEAIDGLADPPIVICTDAGADGVVNLADLEQAEPRGIVPRADDDLAALLYTGGTTGRAKGVMLSHANLHYSGGSVHEAANVPGVNRGLTTLPLSHAYGLLLTVAALHATEQATTVLLRWFEPTAFLELLAAHEIQHTAVVPTMLQILLGLPLEDYDLASLQYVGSGAAPLPAEVESEFCRRVPSVTIRQGYGLTETAALVSTNPTGAIRSGSVGLPIPGTELEIRDGDGRVLPAGEIGEICVRSPGVMRGYWHSPEATAEAVADGWLHTGDVGRVDDEGYLYIVDRKKDLIIRGGFNVYPRDVEDALVEHPAVQIAAVVGRPSERHGEEVVAFVSLKDGADVTPEDLIEWARGRIGGYKYPREVHVIDAIPVTAVGKLDRKALRGRVCKPAAATAT
jgi:long-chain acyl-CoA synthetase